MGYSLEMGGSGSGAVSTCECNDAGNCNFDVRWIEMCLAKVCDLGIYTGELSLGFTSNDPDSHYYDPTYEAYPKEEYFQDQVVNCDNTVPANHSDPYIAGKAVQGETCYIACKDGYIMPDDTDDGVLTIYLQLNVIMIGTMAWNGTSLQVHGTNMAI